MTAFQIKLFAIIFMIIDHIGMFFFPQMIMFRMVGRISFPLFAWLVANGARHTHNLTAYLARIAIFAIISQMPYMLAHQQLGYYNGSLNVLFTLGLGLTAIMFIKKTENRFLWVLVTAVCAIAAHVLNTDYGMFGVSITVVFYLFFKHFKSMLLIQSIIFIVPYILLAEYKTGSVEPLGLAALLFIAFYNGKEGLKAKYLFYIVYPLQYLVFYLLIR